MNENLRQVLLLDTFLENWDGVRVRMGRLPADQEAELARLAAMLAAVTQPGEVAGALDSLLELTEDTPAYPYVRQLIQRCDIPESAITRGIIGEKASDAFAATDVMQASAALAAAAGSRTDEPVEFDVLPIFFVTNRQADTSRPMEERYTGARAEAVSYGWAPVTIPRHAHRIGRVERPPHLRLFGRELPLGRETPEHHVVLGRGESFNADTFASALAQAMGAVERQELLVFLHGYRVTFEEAARRAAQVANDIGFGGVVLLFSWPSVGTFLAYPADEDSAALSAEPLRALLRDLEGGPWTQVHLLAHSMGNRVMAASLAGHEPGWTLPIQNVVLVAADLEIGLFKQQFPQLRQRVRQEAGGLVTSYTSSTDRALCISSLFHRSTRLGRLGDTPLGLVGLESVDATATDTSLLGLHHGYFAEQRSLLTDLGLLLREGLPAARRGLAPVQGQWWTFPR